MSITKTTLLMGISLVIAAAVGNAAAQEMSGKMIPHGDLEWVPMMPDTPMQTVTLWGDPEKGPYGALVKVPPGFEVPMHAHTGDYSGINLQGTWRRLIEGGEWVELPAGSYVFQPGKEMHADTCFGPDECILFITQNVGRDFIPKEQ